MKIIEIIERDDAIYSELCRLIDQLSAEPKHLSMDDVDSVVKSSNSHLLILVDQNNTTVGMLTICLYKTLAKRKAWIEDVVVDTNCRGKGYGKILLEAAIEQAKLLGADTINLTSSPKRIAANNLYRSLNFVHYQTNVYAMKIEL